MNQPALIRQLEALRAQVDALIEIASEDERELAPVDEAPRPGCPRCNSLDLATAGGGEFVCGGCGANVKNGEVIRG